MLQKIKKAVGIALLVFTILGGVPMGIQVAPVAEAGSRGMMDIEGNYNIDWSWGDSSLRFKIGGGMFGEYPYTYQGEEATPDGYTQYYIQANDIDGNYTSWIIKSCSIDGHFGIKIYKYNDDGSVAYQGKGRLVY